MFLISFTSHSHTYGAVGGGVVGHKLSFFFLSSFDVYKRKFNNLSRNTLLVSN